MPANVRITIAIVVLASALQSTFTAADTATLDDATSLQKDTRRQSAQSRQAINLLDAETRRTLSEYQALQESIDALTEENRHLTKQRQQVAREQEALEAGILKTIRLLSTLPALNQNIHENYGRFLALDLPYQGDHREQEYHLLGELLNDSRQSPVENYLALVRQLRTTAEQGLQIKHWTGKLPDDRQVTFFRLGHIALYYLTPDGNEGAIWDQGIRSWTILPMQSRHKLERAIRMSAQREPSGWLVLPLPTHSPQTESDA